MPQDFERLSKVNLAYLAGLIDGEGCIYLKRRAENSTWLQLMLTISQKDVAYLNKIKELIGKRCYFRKPGVTYTAANLVYSSNQAYEILKAIVPYLKLKREQAEFAIDFYENCKVPAGRKPRGIKLWQYMPELWEEREMLFWAIKRLKDVRNVA